MLLYHTSAFIELFVGSKIFPPALICKTFNLYVSCFSVELHGWDKLLVGPDNGENCQQKLASVPDAFSVNTKLFQSVPKTKDVHWTNRPYNLPPNITFGTIYDYLVDSKVILNKISCLESIVDKNSQSQMDTQKCSKQVVMVYLLSTLGHWIRLNIFFLQDDHVQNIKYYPLPSVPDHVCITTIVLPSMRKDHAYSIIVRNLHVLLKPVVHVRLVAATLSQPSLQPPSIVWRIISILVSRKMNEQNVKSICKPKIFQ